MVQRKAVNKLGIRAESLNSHATSEKRSSALKPCHQHPDSRNKGGGEIKKKMKKSRSFKSSDFESLRSPMRRDQSQLKKLSVDVSYTAAQQKKTPYRSPNYMKPTSSSDARRESFQLQVSPPTIIPDKSKNSRNSNRLKPSLASSLKPMKVLMRKSSLRLVRSSMKKSCGVALYPNLDVSRSTCSSTLKDSKFPMYVDLHPGGTESEGTSVMKVCPYTYCSLNGHHHVPSPPLKHFLSARRRLLKTQKSMKLKGLPGDRTKEIDTGQMVFDGDPVILESGSAGSAISPVVEVHTDFFVEIFANPRGEIAELVNYGDARKICNGDDGPKIDFAEIPQVLKEASSDDNDEKPPPASSESTETKIEEEDEDAKSQFDEPNSKTIDGDDLGQNSALSTAEMDVSMTFHEDDEFDQEEEAQDTDSLDYWIQEVQVELASECWIESNGSKETEVIWGGIGKDASVSDAIDMDWEEEEVPYADNGIDYSMFSDDGSVSVTAHLPGNEDPQDLACDSDDSVRTYEEETEETIVLQEACEEDTESILTLFGGAAYGCNDVKLDDRDESLEINEASDASEESTVLHAEETERDILNSTINNTNVTPSDEEVFGNSTQSDQKSNPEYDYDFFYEHASVKADTKVDLFPTELRPLESDTETDQSAATGDNSSGFQHADTDPERPHPNELDDGSVLKGQTSETSESEMDHLVIAFYYSQEQVLQSADVVGDEAERKEGNGSNGLLKIQNPEFSEPCQDIANENHTAEYINMETEVCLSEGSLSLENKSNQEVIDPDSFTPDQSIPPATQCTFDDRPGMHHMDKNRDSEKDQAKLEYCCISKSNCFEECDDTERYVSTTAEDCIVTDNEMQLEDKPMLSTEEPYVTADNIQIPEKYETIKAGTNANEPPLETCNNLKGKPRKAGKRPIENYEQLKKFNPRAPQYLDLEPDPEAEKVDLRHQMMDERKNAEEWMIDYALQQAVTKLAPARKRRVALLVEAFETVTPLPKFEPHLQHSAPSFTHSRPIQACS
ncbi:hypothetical protein AAC387_Pa01g1848 [Persea americana]